MLVLYEHARAHARYPQKNTPIPIELKSQVKSKSRFFLHLHDTNQAANAGK